MYIFMPTAHNNVVTGVTSANVWSGIGSCEELYYLSPSIAIIAELLKLSISQVDARECPHCNKYIDGQF